MINMIGELLGCKKSQKRSLWERGKEINKKKREMCLTSKKIKSWPQLTIKKIKINLWMNII
jgi:hypothetical protein